MPLVRIVLAAAILVVGYLFLRSYTKIYLGELLLTKFLQLFGFSTKWLQDAARDRATKSKLRFSRENKAQREKDKLYQYYTFVDDILVSMHLREIGITVEGFTIVCGMIAILISVLCWFVVKSIFMVLIVFGIVYVALLASMYLKSRMGAMERKKYLLTTIDMLCSNMSDGILKAVQDNIRLIHPSVRPIFQRFIRNVTVLNVSTEDAVIALNNELGSTFDVFCETVILYERDRAPGMDVLFSFIVADNAKETLRDVKIQRSSDKVIKDFFASCAILLGVMLYTILSFDFVGQFYASSLGQFILIMYAMSALVVFIITQVIMGKPYIYKEK